MLAVLALQALGGAPPAAPAIVTCDAVVYGGTSAGVVAAVRLKDLGHDVVLLSPDGHLGGLTSSGLGWTDTGQKEVIGGMARAFYGRVFDHYAEDSAWIWQGREEYGNRGQGTPAMDGTGRTMWIFEPHVAEDAFEELVRDSKLSVTRDAWLDRAPGGVLVSDTGSIRSIRTLDGATYRARIFIDATYEGDLMAAAGVSFHVGRESNATYGENWNGVQPDARHHGHHFNSVASPVDPYVIPGDSSSGLISKVDAEGPGAAGSGDHRIQAYCFRMCLTDHPENRVPFTRPEGYERADYELMARIFEAGWRSTIPPFDPIPNRKTDTNNHGPMSTDNIGANYDYPEASYARRREIAAEHERYQRGWLWFLKSDPRVPAATRAQMTNWGLAADEFVDNGNWPYLLYIREARRMVGALVMTEHHVMGTEAVPKPIGMGSYTMDSHNVQRYVTAPDAAGRRRVENEGDVGVRVPGPYAIGYDAIVPLKSECTNLLVPVCVSSSHIAFGSIRMEPVFMVLGESAAVAAHLALEQRVAVQDVPYGALRGALLGSGQILETPTALRDRLAAKRAAERSRSIESDQLMGIVVDNRDAELSGAWQTSTSSARFVGQDYVHDRDLRNGALKATFRARVPEAGRYDVRLAFPHGRNRASNVPVSVTCGAREATLLKVDQRTAPAIEHLMVSLGTYALEAGEQVVITLCNEGTDGYAVADAVQIIATTN